MMGLDMPFTHLTKFLHDVGSGKNPTPFLSQIVFVSVAGFAIIVVLLVVVVMIVVVVDAVVLGFRAVVLGAVVVVIGLGRVPQSTLRGQSQKPGFPFLAGCQNKPAGHF